MDRLLLLDEPFAPLVIALIELLLDLGQLPPQRRGVLVLLARLLADRLHFLRCRQLFALVSHASRGLPSRCARRQLLFLRCKRCTTSCNPSALPAAFGLDLLAAAIPEDAIGLQLFELFLQLLFAFRRGATPRPRAAGAGSAGDDGHADLDGADA